MTTRRSAIQTLAAAIVGAPFINRKHFPLFPGDAQQYSERCLRLMRESIVVDMLAVFSLGPDGTKWMMNPDSFTDADARRWKDSGLTAIHPAQGTGGPDAYQQTYSFLSMIQGFVAAREEFMRIDSADDFAKAKAAGRVGVILGVQNSQHFRTARDVDEFYALGQRISQLTYNSRNMIGNGSTERRDEGLSDFGVGIVAKMNAVGMAVDVSHCGDRTSLDAFEVSKAPVLITHSNARALNQGHPRCKPDEVIKACGKAESIMGITGVRNFVKGSEPTTLDDYVNHFDYVAKMIGIEHVGIGSDIDLFGYDAMPAEDYKRLKANYKGSYAFRDKIDIEGVDHPRRMYNLLEALIKRGYTDAQLTGVLGGNAVRVMGKAWTKVS